MEVREKKREREDRLFRGSTKEISAVAVSGKQKCAIFQFLELFVFLPLSKSGWRDWYSVPRVFAFIRLNTTKGKSDLFFSHGARNECV